MRLVFECHKGWNLLVPVLSYYKGLLLKHSTPAAAGLWQYLLLHFLYFLDRTSSNVFFFKLDVGS